jgi:LCP family protein required for cell wall assembly
LDNQNQHQQETRPITPVPTSPATVPAMPAINRMPPTKKPRRWKRILLALFVLPVLCCGLSLLVYVIIPPPQTNILVMGLDSRDGEGWMARSDSVMLVGINPGALRTSLLSIPRDLSVNVPGYGLQRINTVNVLGEMESAGTGPALLGASITQDLQVSVDRYVRVDFNGFTALVDAVGGVTIDVPRVIEDWMYPTADYGTMHVRFEAGVQHMDGERALIYARTRHADDDYRRAERQQQVISALLGKLANPFNWPGALVALNSAVDTDLSVVDMALLAPPVVVNMGRFEQLVIEREHITASASGAAIPNYTVISPWLDTRFR